MSKQDEKKVIDLSMRRKSKVTAHETQIAYTDGFNDGIAYVAQLLKDLGYEVKEYED